MVIRPPVGAIKRASNKASSFFPLPPCPMTATCSASETVKLIPSRTRLPSSSARDKLTTESSPVRGVEVFGLRQLQTGVDHSAGLELFYDLLVFDPRILFNLIKIEEFLPRRRQILVCRQHRDQGAERKIAADNQISSDSIKEKRCELGNEIIEEFHEKFALVNLEPYIVNRAQKMGEGGQLPLHGIVGMDVDNPGRRLWTRSATSRTVRTRRFPS